MSEYPAPYDPYAPKPPARSTAKTVAGVALGAVAVLAVLGLLSSIVTGSAHTAGGVGHSIGMLIGLALFVVLPAWGAWRLLTSHQRDVKAFQAEVEEQRRQRRLNGGF